MAKPINETQRKFEQLREHAGSPDKKKVLQLLMDSGQALNARAYDEATKQFKALPDANPWHICFAIGLAWGHLAKLELDFTEHAVNVLHNWNDHDLSGACAYHLERGPDPIRKSLAGAYILFDKVKLPPTLPMTLSQLGKAQERWLSPILSPGRPAYIGSWNSTAMFMAALFAQPCLAKTQRDVTPILPPGGPIYAGLKILYDAKLLSKAPAGSTLDESSFEPGALYENNALLAELVAQRADWCMVDVHSGVYMLGTRDPRSDSWI